MNLFHKLTSIERVIIMIFLVGLVCGIIGLIFLSSVTSEPQYLTLDEFVVELQVELQEKQNHQQDAIIEKPPIKLEEETIIDSKELEEVIEQEPVTIAGKININTASLEQLQQLKGIGASKAAAIIEERERAGLFKSIEDIKRVKGIGDKIFQTIKESIVN